MAFPRHYRVTILNKVVEILKRRTHGRPNTLAGDRIYRQKYSPLSDNPEDNPAHLPAIIAYVNHEENEQVDWTQDRRTCQLILEFYAVVDDDIEDALDVMTEQAAIVFRRDQTLEQTLEWIRYKTSEWIYSKDSDSIIEGARVTYECRYIWDSTSTLALDDLDEVDITYHVGDQSLTQTIEVTQ